MCPQMREPEVTLTDVILRHVEMGLAIIEAFSAEQRQELKRYSEIVNGDKKKKSSKRNNKIDRKAGGILEAELPRTIPFKTLSYLHETLKKHFNDDISDKSLSIDESEESVHRPCAYLHELLRGSSLHIPELPEPTRNPELEARCQRLRLEQQEKEYQKMVTDVSASTLSTCADLASEYSKAVQTTSSALIVVFNVVLTVGAAFFFGFFAASYSLPTPNLAAQALVGVLMATVVAAADLYFLVKTGF